MRSLIHGLVVIGMTHICKLCIIAPLIPEVGVAEISIYMCCMTRMPVGTLPPDGWLFHFYSLKDGWILYRLKDALSCPLVYPWHFYHFKDPRRQLYQYVVFAHSPQEWAGCLR